MTTTRTIARNASAAVLAAALMLGAAAAPALAQGYAGSAASTASVLGATASPPVVQLPAYGSAGHHSRGHTAR